MSRRSSPPSWPPAKHAGADAEVTVTVKSIKERELPEADDEFAQLASEFDTIEELRENLVEQVKRVKRIQQAEKIRDNALELLLEKTEVPLPEAIVQAQVDQTVHNAIHGLDHDEDNSRRPSKPRAARARSSTPRPARPPEKAVKTQLLMDAIADDLDIQVGQNDLTERLVLMSRQVRHRAGAAAADPAAEQQLPAMFADVRRVPDRRRGGRGGHRHRQRGQRGRHRRVLRPPAGARTTNWWPTLTTSTSTRWPKTPRPSRRR